MKDDILILIKGLDKTEEIDYYEFKEDKCLIIYKNDKKYNYRSLNVQVIDKTKEYNIEYCSFYNKGKLIEPIFKAIRYGDYIKFWRFGTFKEVYELRNIEIDKNIISLKEPRNVFEYLKALAITIDGEDGDFLEKRYNELKTISGKSILGLYLLKGEIKKSKSLNQRIFPFGLNLSQRKATINALENNLSVIEGPPGTGKTQTILNIIANAILNNKTVAVVSNNNSATMNVLEKLKKYDLDFLCAYLGNRENREKFFKNQSVERPKLEKYKLNSERLFAKEKKLEILEKEITNLLEEKNKLAKLKIEFSELKLEYKYFLEYCNFERIKEMECTFLYSVESNYILKMLLEYEEIVRLNKKPKGFKVTIFTLKQWKKMVKFKGDIVDYIKQLFILDKKNKEFFMRMDKVILDYFRNEYYNVRLCEEEETILNLENKLKKVNYESLLEEYTRISMEIFKNKLAKKYSEEKTIFEEEVLRKNPKAFINEYPIILSTTHSLRASGGANFLFDYVIIDEASQVDIVAGGLALSCAKNAVIVGDLKQLPNIITNKEQTRRIFNKFNIGQEYMYENSLLSSIVEVFKDAPKTLLKEHYRCHPKIIGFCNKKFYNNELIIFTRDNEEDDALKLYVTAEGNHNRGTYNQREIDVIKDEVFKNLENKDDIGIISPYRKQANSIEIEGVESDTVHKYQGREKKTIIITTTTNSLNEFVDGDELVNVAISRAIEKLILVTSKEIEKAEKGNIGDLIKYIKYNNFEVVDSKIHSTFDFLYKDYEKQMKIFKKTNKSVSEHDSENLMNSLIEEILKQNEFNFLDKVMHQPLQMLIKDKKILTTKEKSFLSNPLTHTDFLIYSKVDKSPVLVIEVDGYKFHNNKVQKERDMIKDEILNKYGIPILRLKTNGSLEREKIEKKLASILYEQN